MRAQLAAISQARVHECVTTPLPSVKGDSRTCLCVRSLARISNSLSLSLSLSICLSVMYMKIQFRVGFISTAASLRPWLASTAALLRLGTASVLTLLPLTLSLTRSVSLSVLCELMAQAISLCAVDKTAKNN